MQNNVRQGFFRALQEAGATPTPPVQAPGSGLGQAMGATMGTQRPPSYEVGGAVGPGGYPAARPGLQQGQAPQPMSPEIVEREIQDMIANNPQMVQQIKMAVDQAVASGELTMQELNTLLQLATAVLRNPGTYPQIRQFAIAQGVVAEQDAPQEYDQGLMIAIIIAGRAAQQGAKPQQSLEDGGTVRGASDAPVPITAHEGEYVIPKHVVEMKGREFFDKMLANYEGDGKGGNAKT